jgi:hypothetical protein
MFKDIANRLTSGPFANPDKYSRVLSEPLGEPIFWEGREWAVTSRGIERRDGKYFIAANRLWEGESTHCWIRNMEENESVDLQDFAIALILARIKFTEKCPKNLA